MKGATACYVNCRII